jgi:hypothetical protein
LGSIACAMSNRFGARLNGGPPQGCGGPRDDQERLDDQ